MPPVRRRARWGLRLLVALALVMVGLAAVIGLLGQESSTRWLLAQVPGLTAEGVRGPLFGARFSADKLVWRGGADGPTVTLEDVHIDGLQWHVLPQPSHWIAIRIDVLAARRVAFTSGKPGNTPITAPVSLALPLELVIERFSANEIQIDQLAPLRDVRARVHAGADDGQMHRLEGVALAWQRYVFEGDLRIATSAPLTVHATIAARADQGVPWVAQLQADGPLARLPLVLALKGEAAGDTPASELNARATVAPFQAWPLDTLALNARDLDLAALLEGAPATRLAGTATLQAPGAKEPVRAEIALTNSQPGRWDEGRLPVRSLGLDAFGHLDQRDRLDITRFDVLLGSDREPAGRWRGQGQWLGDALSLDTRVDDLRPQRLDRRAAALSASGPVIVQISGVPSPVASDTPASPLQVVLKTTLSGRLDALGKALVRLELSGQGSAQKITIEQLKASAGGARVTLEGSVERIAPAVDTASAAWQLRSRGNWVEFDPRVWWPGTPGSAWARGPHRLNGQWRTDLLVADTLLAGAAPALTPLQRLRRLRGEADLQLTTSVLAGVPLESSLSVKARGSAAAEITGQLTADGNTARIGGRLGAATDGRADSLSADINAPRLVALAPLFQLGPAELAAWAPRKGSLTLQAGAEGAWPNLKTQGTASARELQLGDTSLARGDARWQLAGAEDAPLALNIQIDDLRQGSARLDRLRADVVGSRRTHTLVLDASSPLRPPAWAESLLGRSGTGSILQVRAQGEWARLTSAPGTPGTAGKKRTAPADNDAADAYVWRARMPLLRGSARDNSAAVPWLAATDLSVELRFDAAGRPTYAAAAPGRVQVPASALRWTQAQWRGGGSMPRIDLNAELEPIAVASLLARLQPDFGWTGDLRVGGRAVIHSGERFDADIVFERSGGDLLVTDGDITQSLNLSAMRLAVSAHDGLWQFSQAMAGGNFGGLAGAQWVNTSPQRIWPEAQARVEGVLELQVANLGAWGAWVPPGWRLQGQLRTSASVSGLFGNPEITGEMIGSGIGARNVLQGVSLQDGEVSIALNGTRAEIRQFTIHAGEGLLSLTGGANLGEKPEAIVRMQASKFQALGRLDRRVVVSGNADLRLNADSLKLDGDLTVDEGLIDFSRADAPALDADVVVIRDETVPLPELPPVPAWLRDSAVELRVNLGQALRIRGRGLNTTLQGNLRVATPGGRPSITGTVSTVSGTYVAYGQSLIIDRGEIAFSGTPENPRLDILAIRPNLDIRVGVAVAGTAQNPRIRLVSEPEMSDFDKMSWLVLGRASDGLGRTDTALLQRAALALLSGEGSSPTDNFLNKIGLTDFSLRQSDETIPGQSADTVVSVGRQLSQRWYLGYERSVNATTGTWQLIYRVARRLTVRAQSGDDDSLDVIWSWRW